MLTLDLYTNLLNSSVKWFLRTNSNFEEFSSPKRTSLGVRRGKLIWFLHVELISIVSEFPDNSKINAECFLVLCCIENTKGFQRIQICVADCSNRGYCSEFCIETHAKKYHLLLCAVIDEQPSDVPNNSDMDF